jgi:predicted small secreted protein
MSQEAIIAALLALAAYATATQNTTAKAGEVKSGTQRG